MALMGQPGQGKDNVAPAAAAPVTGDAKAKKEAAIARFKANRAAKQKAAYDNALKLRDELVKGQYLDKLTAPVKEFVLSLCKDPSEKIKSGGFGGPSVFSLLFGDAPTVGQKITLEEAFNKTYKGKSTLDLWVKRWAEKGIVVECIVDSAKMLNTTYTIKALPAA
jgi:hypothetical protein